MEYVKLKVMVSGILVLILLVCTMLFSGAFNVSALESGYIVRDIFLGMDNDSGVFRDAEHGVFFWRASDGYDCRIAIFVKGEWRTASGAVYTSVCSVGGSRRTESVYPASNNLRESDYMEQGVEYDYSVFHINGLLSAMIDGNTYTYTIYEGDGVTAYHEIYNKSFVFGVEGETVLPWAYASVMRNPDDPYYDFSHYEDSSGKYAYNVAINIADVQPVYTPKGYNLILNGSNLDGKFCRFYGGVSYGDVIESYADLVSYRDAYGANAPGELGQNVPLGYYMIFFVDAAMTSVIPLPMTIDTDTLPLSPTEYSIELYFWLELLPVDVEFIDRQYNVITVITVDYGTTVLSAIYDLLALSIDGIYYNSFDYLTNEDKAITLTDDMTIMVDVNGADAGDGDDDCDGDDSTHSISVSFVAEAHNYTYEYPCNWTVAQVIGIFNDNDNGYIAVFQGDDTARLHDVAIDDMCVFSFVIVDVDQDEDEDYIIIDDNWATRYLGWFEGFPAMMGDIFGGIGDMFGNIWARISDIFGGSSGQDFGRWVGGSAEWVWDGITDAVDGIMDASGCGDALGAVGIIIIVLAGLVVIKFIAGIFRFFK